MRRSKRRVITFIQQKFIVYRGKSQTEALPPEKDIIEQGKLWESLPLLTAFCQYFLCPSLCSMLYAVCPNSFLSTQPLFDLHSNTVDGENIYYYLHRQANRSRLILDHIISNATEMITKAKPLPRRPVEVERFSLVE